MTFTKRNDSASFSKDDTQILKGVAILAMILHHVAPNNTSVPVYLWDSFSLEFLLASCGKVCVSVLTVLSGFGLAESFKRLKEKSFLSTVKFTVSHLIQLYSLFWSATVLVSLMYFIKGTNPYGSGLLGIKNIICAATGFGYVLKTPTVCGGWYIAAIIVFYLLFPLVNFLTKKIKWGMLIITYLPWVYYIYKKDINMHTDWWLFYLCSFVFGIYLSQSEFLAKQRKISNIFLSVGSCVFLVGAIILRAYVTLPADIVLAFALVEFEIFVLNKIPVFRDFLKVLGKNSSNMWLIHYAVLQDFLSLSFRTTFWRYSYIVFITLGISVVLEMIKNGTGFTKLVKYLRSYFK